MKWMIALVVAASCAACGSDSPAAPAAPATANVAGVWRANAVVTTVTGGECVGATLIGLGFIGATSTSNAAINQNGSNLSVGVTALSNGATCNYTGSVGASALTLTWVNCSAANLIAIRCSNGSVRDALLQNSGISGNVSGNTLFGTEADSYNVVVSGTNIPVGVMVVNSSFNATRQ